MHQQEHLNEMEMEGKDTVPRTIQPSKHRNVEHIKAIRQPAIEQIISRNATNKCIVKKITL